MIVHEAFGISTGVLDMASMPRVSISRRYGRGNDLHVSTVHIVNNLIPEMSVIIGFTSTS